MASSSVSFSVFSFTFLFSVFIFLSAVAGSSRFEQMFMPEHLTGPSNATGIRLGMRRLDKWGSFSLAAVSQSILQELFDQLLGHDLLRANSLASRLTSSALNSTSTQRQLEFTAPVTFTNGGVYYSEITLGTPGTKFNLIMDTGSDLTWVRCDNCLSCSSSFNRLTSDTYKSLACSDKLCSFLHHSNSDTCQASTGCTYSYGYGDGSTTHGDLSTDTLSILESSSGALEKFPGFVFGCGVVHKGLLEGESGLLGLSPGSLSFPTQLGDKYGRMFSYCLLRQTSENAAKQSPLIFGDAAVYSPGSNSNSNSGAKELQFTPVVDNSVYFTVELEGISVGSQLLDLQSSQFKVGQKGVTIFDSGTTLTMLPPPVCDSIKSSLSAQLPGLDFVALNGLDACFSPSSTEQFPDISFHFQGGADFVTPPDNYIVDVGSLHCLVFVPANEISIIGNLQQQDFLVVHDLENMRIGFRPADCAADST